MNSWTNLLKDATEFDDQSSSIFHVWDKCRKAQNEFHQLDQSCQSFTQIKQCLDSNPNIQDVENLCKQYQSEKWAIQFSQILPNCTTDSLPQKLDPQKAKSSLTACFDREFLNSFGYRMLFYSLQSLFQSYKAWNLIRKFHIPTYENQIRRTREKLDECAILCNPFIDLTILNQQQINQLKRVQELLRDIKDTIQFIIDDLQNKIIEAEKYRSNSYLSAFMNGISTVLNAMLWDKIGAATGENSRSSLTAGTSTLIQAGCTVGDLIHANKANDLIDRLQDILKIMKDLEEDQQRLSTQVTEKLSDNNIQT